jgi:Xaa-Pro dipeptidase
MPSDPKVFSRRRVLQLSAASAALASPAGGLAQAPEADDLPPAVRSLAPLPDPPAPVTVEERQGRLAKARRRLADAGLDALVLGPGSSLAYLTGAEWGLSERFLGCVLAREGDPVWITPAFEEDRARERIRVGTDVRAWQEDESPYALVAAALREKAAATGRVGIEETMPFAFSNGIATALPAAKLTGATEVTAACRMVKDAHEIALIRRACTITLHAYRAVFASLREGLSAAQVSGWVAAAHRKLGARGGALVLFGPDAAFPHGTKEPRALRAGDVVLVDGGCTVHGYQSDVTRTGVFGAPPTERQRRVWELVRRAQQAAFDAARPGAECQAVDAAARRVIEEGGFGPGYRYFTHRLGHGIGLDGHEWPYMVRGSTTRLVPGVTFTDEPGIYVRGEMGVRHEDTVVVTESGGENLCPKWSGTPEGPAVV